MADKLKNQYANLSELARAVQVCLNPLIGPLPRVKAALSSDLSASAGVWTTVSFNVNVYDPTGMHFTSGSSITDFTIARPGVYLANGNMACQSGSSGSMWAGIAVNGEFVSIQHVSGDPENRATISTLVLVQQNDVITLAIKNGNSSMKTLRHSGTAAMQFSLQYLDCYD